MIDAQGNAHDGAGQFTEKNNSDPEVELPGRPQAYVVATSATDDAAYESLADLSTLLEGREETVVIGGHMVSLICTAFPSPGLVERRTGDADAGIPVELAATGEMHEGLLDLGYVAEGANRYLHSFAPEQPDLNWDHPEVREDFLTTLRFWSDRGVDGFRIDVAHKLTKDLTEPLPSRAELDAMDRTSGRHP